MAGTSRHRRFQTGPRAWFYGSALYRWFALSGRVTPTLLVLPPDPWPGDVEQGADLLRHIFRFAGQTLQGEEPPWLPESASPGWLAEMHGFDWLRHLRSVGGDAARRQARALVAHWIETQGRGWNAVTWSPDLIAARLASWIGQHDFFLSSADDATRAMVFDSMGRQLRHLSRALPGRLQGLPLLLAIKGLIYGGLCLPGQEAVLERGRKLLLRELQRQILPDGGHVERNPSVQLQVLRHLIDMRGCFRAARIAVPDPLQYAIDRATPTVRFFRHGDGGLCLFNGGQEEESILIDTVLGQADARGRPLRSAPHIGFERMTAGRTCIILDAGVPSPPGLDEAAHAGTLSFEMSVGRDRLIVNCGAHPSAAAPWRAALAASAAHSTLVVGDTNSSAVLDGGGLSRRAAKVETTRQESQGNILVEASHDGYRDSHGLTHSRRLYLAESGEDLRGEDILSGAAGQPFALRFHLHPDVHPEMVDDGSMALRTGSGAVWRLRIGGDSVDQGLELADSIYLGGGLGGGDPLPTRQVLLRGVSQAGQTSLKWALRRERSDPEQPTLFPSGPIG